MLTYLLRDVLRIFAGDFKSGEIDGQPASQWMWFLAAVVLLIPIVMVVLSLNYPAIRWVSIVAAIFLVVFNLIGLPYPSAYDNFLIVFGFLFNGLIVWSAWTWVPA